MSCVKNINRFVVPNDVLAKLTDIYKYIGKSESYYKITQGDFNRIFSQTIERDTYFLAKLINLDITDARLRLIISKNSAPRNRDEKILYTLKEILTNFLQYPNKQGIDTQSLTNLINYIYPKMGVRFDVYKDDRRNNPNFAGKSKREILDDINLDYENAVKTASVERLILLINYFIDITALQPFTEHNDCLPYLLLYLMLNQANYNALTYVSIFEVIYFNKAEFEDELKNACYNWTEEYHQVLPFVRYFIDLLDKLFIHCNEIIQTYEEDNNINKANNIENTIYDLPNIFTKDEIRLNHPYVSESTINRALKKLHDEGIIRPLGKGRSAKWLKIGIK